ncbi:MAG: HIT family protein [Planctomycetes bacterium]|nr:HIT family protein [Planctomycetota bacterium]
MSDCIFCKIVSGQIPCTRVHETADCLAFLDIGPLAPGHTLLIPKSHVRDITEASPELVATLSREIPTLSRAILGATGATGLNILQNTGPSSGQVVMHLHIHLIPRLEGDSLGFRWNAGSYAAGQADAMRDRIIAALQHTA